MVLPDASLTRNHAGNWQVFIEDEQGFKSQPVTVVQRQQGMNLVRDLTVGSTIVIAGAQFLASKQVKPSHQH